MTRIKEEDPESEFLQLTSGGSLPYTINVKKDHLEKNISSC